MKIKIIAMLLLLVLCSGCSAPVALSERAIVKAIFVEQADEGYSVALALFTCTPTSDVASVTGEAKVCVGTGASVDSAMQDAQAQQHKKIFFAHNRILLVGESASQSDVGTLLQQFGETQNMPQSTGAFLTNLSLDDFEQADTDLPTLVREVERIIDSDTEQGSDSLIALNANGQNGLLGVLAIDTDDAYAVSLPEVAVLFDGVPQVYLSGNHLALARVLAGKADTLTLEFAQGETQYVCKTQPVFLRKEVVGDVRNPCLALTLQGKIESISAQGKVLHGTALDEATAQANIVLGIVYEALHRLIFLRQNDVFALSWHLKQQNLSAVEQLVAQNAFYTETRVVFHSALEAR